jgi:choline dehydrogenase-like flavoprotein
MQIDNLDDFDPGSEFEADIAIIGAGPAGITIAREFLNSPYRVLLIESGLVDEHEPHMALNQVESEGEPAGEAAINFRRIFHGPNMGSFNQQAQPYGMRVRAFGGSAKYWGGRSATFDQMDFAKRDWVPFSGWPVSRESLKPYFDRAADWLNLGPNCYDEEFWKLLGGKIERPPLDRSKLRSCFWQYARSRRDLTQMKSFGADFKALDSGNVRVLVNATVTQIEIDEDGKAFSHLEVSTINNVRSKVTARLCVLASGGIENARLLLASNRKRKEGLGNKHDIVGRFLMDHPGTRLGHFTRADLKKAGYLGFYTLRKDGHFRLYLHGLTFSPEFQAEEKLLNAAIYTLPEISPDDPIEALKRLARFKSENPFADIWALITSVGLLSKAVGLKVFQSKLMPHSLQNLIINFFMVVNPSFVVREFQSKGVPHKLDCLSIHVMTEQVPDPESRIVLSESRDPLGMPRAKATWKISEADRHNILRIGQLLRDELPKARLPAPVMADWIVENRPQDAPLVDMAHATGATRMSSDPKTGVVDANCKVHDVENLYIAGASVFPTSGHANPTLMITSLALRLADHLKVRMTTLPASVIAPRVPATSA